MDADWGRRISDDFGVNKMVFCRKVKVSRKRRKEASFAVYNGQLVRA